MRFQNLNILAFASVGVAQSWPGMESIPDGPFTGIVYANWSTTMTHLESGTKFFFKLYQESKGTIQKRKSTCLDYQLNHGGVDGAYDSIKRWAGDGQTLVSHDTTRYYGFSYQGVYVYACVNDPWQSYTFVTHDISLAFENMDGRYGKTCEAYEASFYEYPSTVKIVGKARSGSAVCLG